MLREIALRSECLFALLHLSNLSPVLERANLTAESGKDKVLQALGCSKVHANRILNKLRGENLRRATFCEQILALLGDGEKKEAEVVAAIEGNPKAINHELVRLANTGEIVKVRWGVYALPNPPSTS